MRMHFGPPRLSPAAWLAAHQAAERAIPRLLKRGHIEYALNLARRSQQFKAFADRPATNQPEGEANQ